MKEIITDLKMLTEPAEQLRFLDDSGTHKEEGDEIVKELKDALAADASIIALSAPQIGIKKRIIGVRFADEIKIFINPIITKKADYKVGVETCASMPGKEILIARPEDITVVYTNGDFKYEDNKFVDYAARILDQQINLLDGVPPAELGLVSDIAEDGSFAELNDEEKAQALDIYKQFVSAKLQAVKTTLADDEMHRQYKKMKLAEDVINGRTLIIENPEEKKKAGNREQRRMIEKQVKKAQSKYKQKANAKRRKR